MGHRALPKIDENGGMKIYARQWGDQRMGEMNEGWGKWG